MRDRNTEQTRGIIYAGSSFLLWGFLPLYWKALDHIPPLQVLCHRVVWTFIFMVLLIAVQKRWAAVRQTLHSKKTILTLSLTAGLLGSNWFIYILALNTDRVLDASMGYYINPLIYMLMGVIFLKEKLKFWQGVAAVLALAGVLSLLVQYGRFPWISLALACTFGLYGLLKKTVRADAVTGLFYEAAVCSVFALIYLVVLAFRGQGAFGTVDVRSHLFLVGCGVITILPLLLFITGTRIIPLFMLGFLQYLTPTLFFLLGVFVFKEPFIDAYLLAFVLIWAGVIVYSISTGLQRKPAGTTSQSATKKAN